MAGALALTLVLAAAPFEACVEDAERSLEVRPDIARLLCTIQQDNRALLAALERARVRPPPSVPPPPPPARVDWGWVGGGVAVGLVIGVVIGAAL